MGGHFPSASEHPCSLPYFATRGLSSIWSCQRILISSLRIPRQLDLMYRAKGLEISGTFCCPWKQILSFFLRALSVSHSNNDYHICQLSTQHCIICSDTVLHVLHAHIVRWEHEKELQHSELSNLLLKGIWFTLCASHKTYLTKPGFQSPALGQKSRVSLSFALSYKTKR